MSEASISVTKLYAIGGTTLTRCLLVKFERNGYIDLIISQIGIASANISTALDAGVTSVEGSICGIGGGIVMLSGMGVIGNLYTEDIVNMLNQSGIITGLKIQLVLEADQEIQGILHIPVLSFIFRNKNAWT